MSLLFLFINMAKYKPLTDIVKGGAKYVAKMGREVAEVAQNGLEYAVDAMMPDSGLTPAYVGGLEKELDSMPVNDDSRPIYSGLVGAVNGAYESTKNRLFNIGNGAYKGIRSALGRNNVNKAADLALGAYSDMPEDERAGFMDNAYKQAEAKLGKGNVNEKNLRKLAGKYGKKGFTMVELLVVIAVIGVLASLFLPVLNTVKKKGNLINCTNNFSQMGKAMASYTMDYNDMIPPVPNTGHSKASTDYVKVNANYVVGLGYLVNDEYGITPDMLTCSLNTARDGETIIKNWKNDALTKGTPFYREGDADFNVKWSHNGMRAFAMDSSQIDNSDKVISSGHGNLENTNVVFTDGHVDNKKNNSIPGNRFTTNTNFLTWDSVWQNADKE